MMTVCYCLIQILSRATICTLRTFGLNIQNPDGKKKRYCTLLNIRIPTIAFRSLLFHYKLKHGIQIQKQFNFLYLKGFGWQKEHLEAHLIIPEQYFHFKIYSLTKPKMVIL